MKIFESPFRSVRSASVLVGALATLIYANSILNDFAYDDLHIISENTDIHTLGTLPKAVTEPYWPGEFGKQLGLWRPVTTVYLGLQYAVSGENPTLYHVANVLGHAAVSILVVLLLTELMSLPAAFVGGLLFAVHPVHVEAVSNVIGVAEIMSALLFLWACLVHVRGPTETRWPRAIVIALLYGLAVGAKEGAITLPGVIFLLDAARRRLGFAELRAYVRERWRLYLALSVMAGALLFERFRILGSIAHPFGPLGADILQQVPKIWTLGTIWANYVRLWIFPLDLSSDYSPNVIPVSLGWNAENLAGVALALSILVMALVAWRRPEMKRGRDSGRAAAFGVVWFLVTMSPVANVVFLAGVLLAERTFYLPSVGLAAATAWLFVRFWQERPRLAPAVAVACLALLGLRTWTRTPTWRDNLTVFGKMIEDYPQSGRSQWVIGDLYMNKGRVHRALVSYRLAINILGTHYQLLNSIARKLMALERYHSARGLLLLAWHEDPSINVAPANLAVIASEEGDALGTERWCDTAIALGKHDSLCYHLLAWAYAKQGRWDAASEARKKAIDHGEGDYWQQWESLAYLEWHRGDTTAARAAFDSAVSRARAMSRGAVERVDSLRGALLSLPKAPQR